MRHQHKYFPVKFAKNLRTLFSSEHLRWLLLRSTKFLISSAFLLWSVEAAIRGVFCKKVFLEVSQNSHQNTSASGLQLYLKRDSGTVYFVKFLRTPILQNISGRLLLGHVALEIIQLSFSSNGDWKKSICQRNVSFARLKLAEWRSSLSWENFLLKNHTHIVVEKLFLDPFLKNRTGVYLWISSLKFYAVYFYWMLKEH